MKLDNRSENVFGKTRNFHKLMDLRGEINLKTRSESLKKRKFTRKLKHKAKEV